MLGRFKTLAASIRSKQDIIFTSKTRWAIDNYVYIFGRYGEFFFSKKGRILAYWSKQYLFYITALFCHNSVYSSFVSFRLLFVNLKIKDKLT